MKTDDLVTLLARGAAPVPRHAAQRRFARALALGLPLAVLIMLVDYGLRHDLAQALALPMLWVKLGVPLALAAAALPVAVRLGRPGNAPGVAAWGAVAAPVALLWLLGAIVFWQAPEGARAAMVFGSTWRSCPFSIAWISAPVLAAALWALKGLAPVHPARAGAGAGLLAGGAGAAVYALHCPEMAAPFLAVWYVAGIALVVLAGAAIGARWLRW